MVTVAARRDDGLRRGACAVTTPLGSGRRAKPVELENLCPPNYVSFSESKAGQGRGVYWARAPSHPSNT